MDIGGEKIHKIFDEVERTLDALRQSVKRDAEEDAIPRSKVEGALQSLNLLEKTLSSGAVGSEYVGRKRKVLELVHAVHQDSAILTAAGTLQTEFSGILVKVQKALSKDDPKLTKKVDMDPLRK